LAKALDKKQKMDLGYRWLREFFFLDYKTANNTLKDLYLLENIRFGDRYAIPEEQTQFYFSPYLDQLKRDRKQIAEKEFAQSINVEELVKDLSQAIDDFKSDLALVESKTGFTVANAMDFRSRMSSRFAQIVGADDGSFDTDNDLVRNLYHDLQSHYDVIVPTGVIFTYLNHQGLERFRELNEERQFCMKTLNDLLSYKVNHSIKNSYENIERVNDSYRTIKKCENSFYKLYEQIFITMVASQRKI
ncbi:MAG: hypothetical protein KDD40_10235, partial [Bdellovibrionales bacterium]|nr:hypothetical protein [Bdellovibrionales bacterium]